MSETRALAWNTGIQIIGKIISTAIGVVIVGLMTRYLGQVGFGEYSTANAYLQIFALLLDLGLNVTLTALLGEHANDPAFERRCISALFTLRFVLAAVVIVFVAPAIALFFPYSPTLKLAIIALTGSFFFPALTQIATGVQQRHLKMQITAIGEVAGRVILLIGLLFAISEHFGLIPVVLFVSFGSFANFLLNVIFTKAYGVFRWNWDPAFWRLALKRSWPIGLSIAFNLIYYKADTFILSLVRSQAEVGLYGAAYRVLDILVTVPFMYAGVMLPLLSKHWAASAKESFMRLLAQSVNVMFLLVTPMVAGTLVLGRPIMSVIAGSDFAVSGDVLKILILAVGAIYINTVFAHAVVALDAQRKMLPVYISVALVTLAGYLVFIPRYGMWAAAWLTLFSESAVLLGSFFVTRSFVRIHYKSRVPFAAIGASVIMAAAVSLLEHYWLPIPILAGAVIYTAGVFLFGGITKETLKEILTIRKTTEITPLP
ncbi:MAG TPA: flippase [Patescibacteria group bacterium]|nr:flippase [Patescibacteria group bacterium]